MRRKPAKSPTVPLEVPVALAAKLKAIVDHVESFSRRARAKQGRVDFASAELQISKLVSDAEGAMLGQMLVAMDPASPPRPRQGDRSGAGAGDRQGRPPSCVGPRAKRGPTEANSRVRRGPGGRRPGGQAPTRRRDRYQPDANADRIVGFPTPPRAR